MLIERKRLLILSNFYAFVVTVNFFLVSILSVVFHFHSYSLCWWQMKMLGLLLAVFGLLAIIIAGSLQIVDREARWILVGLLSCASLISMFASPLFIIVSWSKALIVFYFFSTLDCFLKFLKFLMTCCLTWSLFPEFSNSNKECWIHAILSLPLYFLDEHLFLPIWHF